MQAGHQVCVIDNLSRGKRQNVPAGATLHVADVADDSAEAIIAELKPSAIFHFAAQMDVRASVQDPVFDAQVNILGTLRLLRAAVQHDAQHFIFASTGGAIYGEQDVFPATETHPCRPESPYGLSKYCAETYLDYFARHSTLRTVALRFANVYGPRQDPHGEAGVVAIFAGKMLAGSTPTLFGDGLQTRDYVYVQDVVDANLAALNHGQACGAYNIGTGVETSLKTLADGLVAASEYRGSLAYGPGRPGEQRRSVIDPSRAQRELGWQPRVGLTAGLAATVAWFAAHTAAPGA